MAQVQTKLQTAISWTLGIGLAVIFAYSGFSKLSGDPDQVQHFARWGYPPWSRFPVGVMELAGAALVAVPSLRRFGAGLLSCIMLGATLTHLRAGEFGIVWIPLTLLALSFALGWLHRPT